MSSPPRLRRRPFRRAPRPASAEAEHGVTLVGESPSVSTTLEAVIHPDAPATEAQSVTIWYFTGEDAPQNITLDQLAELLVDPQGFFWIDLAAYTAEQLRALAAIVPLNAYTLRHMLAEWRRPLLTVFPDACFLSATLTYPAPGHYRLQPGELDIVLMPHVIISAHKLSLPFRDRVLARAQLNLELRQQGPVFLLYVLLDELLTQYEDLNRHIQHASEQQEERALHDTSERFLEDLLRFKRYTFALVELLDHHREVFQAFFRPDFIWIKGDDISEYFRDLQSRLTYLLAALGSVKEAVNSAFTIYASQVSHRTNQIIKVLTMVETILLPATVIIALFGTNITGLQPHYAGIWFGAMLLAIILITGAILFFFYQQRWLSLHRPVQPTPEMD